jgi:hypothetical protein
MGDLSAQLRGAAEARAAADAGSSDSDDSGAGLDTHPLQRAAV